MEWFELVEAARKLEPGSSRADRAARAELVVEVLAAQHAPSHWHVAVGVLLVLIVVIAAVLI